LPFFLSLFISFSLSLFIFLFTSSIAFLSLSAFSYVLSPPILSSPTIKTIITT
jgi:hypothetical protein